MANSVSLYELTGQYLALMDKLADADFDAVTIADTVESTGIMDAITDKAEGVEMVARNFEQYDAAIDAEIDRLLALKAKRHKAADGLREYLKREMIRTGITKIQCPRFTIALRDNPESVEIFDERQLPSRFLKTPAPPLPSPDKAMIKIALKAGKDVPGAKLKRSQRIAIT